MGAASTEQVGRFRRPLKRRKVLVPSYAPSRGTHVVSLPDRFKDAQYAMQVAGCQEKNLNRGGLASSSWPTLPVSYGYL